MQIGYKIDVEVIKIKPIANKFILSHRILLPKPISKKERRKITKTKIKRKAD